MAGAVFVYPSEPNELADVARSGLDAVGSSLRREVPFSWADPGIAGSFVSSPAAEEIDECDYAVADLTRRTFNLSYLTGYAIGKGKPLLITKNSAITDDDHLAREVGLFGPHKHRGWTRPAT
jgi:nucleoside 2-deoxyribosyltransferase